MEDDDSHLLVIPSEGEDTHWKYQVLMVNIVLKHILHCGWPDPRILEQVLSHHSVGLCSVNFDELRKGLGTPMFRVELILWANHIDANPRW